MLRCVPAGSRADQGCVEEPTDVAKKTDRHVARESAAELALGWRKVATAWRPPALRNINSAKSFSSDLGTHLA